MKVTLAMIVRNEEYYLSRILPLVASTFDEIVAVDAESTDRTREILLDQGATVVLRPWTDDYAAARNAAMAKASGDWIVMLDGDEAMFPRHLMGLRPHMERSDLIVLPRIEFVYDHEHYNPDLWPDFQGRAFRNGLGFHFRGRVHEALHRGGEAVPAMYTGGIRLKEYPIYHYGQAKPVSETVLRHHNYDRIRQGLPSLSRLPETVGTLLHHRVAPFPGDHPLKGVR